MIKLLKIVRQILNELDEPNLDDKDKDELDLNKPVPGIDDTNLDTSADNQEEPELKPIDPTGAGTIDINSPLEPEFNTDAPEEDAPEQVKDISPIDAKNMIKSTKGKFFTVWFIKKDGTLRMMNARLAVKAYLKGGELPYNAEEKGLIPCYDVKVQGYRMINWTTIKKLKIGNREYNVK
jgi:hypothetical protein